MARTAAVSTETLNHDRGSLQVQTTLIYSFFPFYANNQLHSFIIALTEKSLCLRNAACNSQQGWSLGHCSLQTTAHGLEEPVAFARVKSSSENSAKNKLHEENPIHGDAFSPEACKTNNSSIGALEEHHGCRLPGVTSPGSHRHRSFAHVTRPFATSRPHAAVLAPSALSHLPGPPFPIFRRRRPRSQSPARCDVRGVERDAAIDRYPIHRVRCFCVDITSSSVGQALSWAREKSRSQSRRGSGLT
jgi:hypothetical protein